MSDEQDFTDPGFVSGAVYAQLEDLEPHKVVKVLEDILIDYRMQADEARPVVSSGTMRDGEGDAACAWKIVKNPSDLYCLVWHDFGPNGWEEQYPALWMAEARRAALQHCVRNGNGFRFTRDEWVAACMKFAENG